MNIIISYDIKDDKRLKEAAKYLEKVSVRVQYSVYLLPNPTKDKLKKIVSELLEIVDEEDSVKVYKFSMKYLIANYDIKNFIV